MWGGGGGGDLLGPASCQWVGTKQAKLQPEVCLLATSPPLAWGPWLSSDGSWRLREPCPGCEGKESLGEGLPLWEGRCWGSAADWWAGECSGGGVVAGTDRAGTLREQHEQSAEVRPPGEKPAEVFLAEPSQG